MAFPYSELSVCTCGWREQVPEGARPQEEELRAGIAEWGRCEWNEGGQELFLLPGERHEWEVICVPTG